MQAEIFKEYPQGGLERFVAHLVAAEVEKHRIKTDARLLGVSEVAARLGVSIPTVWRLVQRRDLKPPKRLGERRATWLSTDVDALIQQLESVPAKAPITASGITLPTRKRGRPRKYLVSAPVSISAASSGI